MCDSSEAREGDGPSGSSGYADRQQAMKYAASYMPTALRLAQQSHDANISDVVREAYADGFLQGFHIGFCEGEAKQAILEIQGRERFLEEVRAELAGTSEA